MYNPIYYGKRSSIMWISIFVVFMVIFTFLDLPIAKAIFHYNEAYGEFFKIMGLTPTCICGTFYAINNLATRKIARRKVISAILSILSLILFVGFTWLSIYNLEKKFFVHTIVFSFCFILISIYFNKRLCKWANLFNMRKVMIIALVSTLVAVAGQTLIKFAFNRPRFISLTDPDAQFTYWFVHFPFTPDSSFPSGHAAQAALCFLLMYFKRFIPALRKKVWDIVLCTISVFMTVSTMLARMFLGAHYATDVWAGAFLTLITISLMNQYVERSYMLPHYRLSSIQEKVEHLRRLNKLEALKDFYDSMKELLERADKENDKNELILTLLHARDDIDVILLNHQLSGREKSQFGIVRNQLTRFVDEVKLENFGDIYSVPVK